MPPPTPAKLGTLTFLCPTHGPVPLRRSDVHFYANLNHGVTASFDCDCGNKHRVVLMEESGEQVGGMG